MRQAAFALLLFTLGCATGSDKTDLARRQIAAVIGQGIEASRRGDVEAFIARLPSDFTVELADGAEARGSRRASCSASASRGSARSC